MGGLKRENIAQFKIERNQILELRSKGLTYSAIAESLGIPPSRVSTRIRSALRKIDQEGVRFQRRIINLECHRMDRAEGRLMTHAENKALEVETRLKAEATLIRLWERRAKLLGLDKQPETTTGPTLNLTIHTGRPSSALPDTPLSDIHVTRPHHTTTTQDLQIQQDHTSLLTSGSSSDSDVG